jgi:hypothetical protein
VIQSTTQYHTFLIRCILLVLVVLGAPVACASAAEPYDQQIIWMDAKEHTAAMFIPERLLNEHALEDLPLVENDRSSLKSSLETAARGTPEREELYKQLGRPFLPCPPASRDDRSSAALALSGYLKTKDLAFVAAIEDVVPGWSFWAGQPVNMVYVRPVLILHGKLPREGRVLIYPERWASIKVNDVKVCYRTPPEGFYRARKGDEILVSGILNPLNSRVLGSVSEFPISRGKILPQPYSMVQDFVPVAIDDLIREMRRNNEPK